MNLCANTVTLAVPASSSEDAVATFCTRHRSTPVRYRRCAAWFCDSSAHTAHNQVVLDAYNANPTSVSHAVASFHARGHASAVVFLGEMGELGPSSAGAHAEAVDQVLGLGLELWTVGDGFKASFQERPQAAWLPGWYLRN